MRGRKRKPTALKILEGVQRSKIPVGEPELPVGVGAPPAFLDAAAKKEWQRVAPVLTAAGVLTEGDRAALAVYCLNWSRWVKAEAMVTKSAEVLKSEHGALHQNPYLTVSRQAQDAMMKAAAVLGLDPANRSRVKATEITRPALSLVRPKTKLDQAGGPRA